MSTVAAIVLAAGLGTRMGGPKALLEVDGESLLRRHVARFAELGARVFVVTRGAYADAVTEILPRGAARLVIGDTASPADSLQLAVRSAQLEANELVFVTPVDVRPASAATLHALRAAMQAAVLAATPQYRAHGGHPVLLRAEALRAYDTGEPLPLRNHLQALGRRRIRVLVDDPNVERDFDVPSDLQATAQR